MFWLTVRWFRAGMEGGGSGQLPLSASEDANAAALIAFAFPPWP